MTIANTFLNQLPPVLRDKINAEAITKIMDYLFNDKTYSSDTLTLPASGATHIPLSDELNNLSIWERISDGSVKEDVLDQLADQWQVLGYEYAGLYYEWNGSTGLSVFDFKLAFIREAFQLKSVIGTPYSIQQILERFGYTTIEVDDALSTGPEILYDGTYKYDGSVGYWGAGAKHNFFNVELTSTHDIAAGSTEENTIIELIGLYRRFRAELYKLTMIDPSNPGGRQITVWTGF